MSFACSIFEAVLLSITPGYVAALVENGGTWDLSRVVTGDELRERIGPRTRGLVPRQPGTTGRELRTDLLGVRVAPIAAPDGTPAGLRVYGTELGTIAQLLRVRPGSVLVSLNGMELLEVEDISRALAARPAGGEIRLRWIEPNGVQTERVWRPNGGEAF